MARSVKKRGHLKPLACTVASLAPDPLVSVGVSYSDFPRPHSLCEELYQTAILLRDTPEILPCVWHEYESVSDPAMGTLKPFLFVFAFAFAVEVGFHEETQKMNTYAN